MEPARAVGGDFFDIMKLDNGLVGVAIADVSDKGVPASLFMMSSRTLLKGAAVGLGEPGAVLQEVNNLLTEDNQGLMFVTVLYAIFDPATGAFTVRQRRAQLAVCWCAPTAVPSCCRLPVGSPSASCPTIHTRSPPSLLLRARSWSSIPTG